MPTITAYQPSMAESLLGIWHAAFGDRFPIMPNLWAANTEGDPDFRAQDLLVALHEGRPVGFALTKRYRGDYPGCLRFREVGYLALLAVHPDHQRRGIGSRLLEAAEDQLDAQDATRVVLGGSFQHFLAGIPDFGTQDLPGFFAARGYQLGHQTWDVRRDLTRGPGLPEVGPAIVRAGVTVRLYREGEQDALLGFLNAEFAGRWPRDVALYLDRGGEIGRLMGVFEGDRPLGFAHLYPPGTAVRWAGFEPAIAALGPIGVAGSLRGKGLGLALLVRGLEQLAAWGAADTVIDWTDLLDFYGRCGFAPWLAYRLASKDLP